MKERGRGEGGRRSIFQKRNLICPEVCHGTRINSRALESRREAPLSDGACLDRMPFNVSSLSSSRDN